MLLVIFFIFGDYVVHGFKDLVSLHENHSEN